MKYIITQTLLLICFFANSQIGYSYSYIDPCSGKQKNIAIPHGQNNITVNYYGNVNLFSVDDFNSGMFFSWLQSIAQINSSQPCGEITKVLTNGVNAIITQNVISTVMNVTSVAAMTQSISSLSTGIGSSNLGNSITNSESGGNSNDKNKKENSVNSTKNNETSSGNNISPGNSTAGNKQESSLNAPASGNISTSKASGPADNSNSNNRNDKTSMGNTESNNSTSADSKNQNNTSNVKSSGSGSTANSIANAEEGGGGSSGGSNGKSAKSSTKTGQMIGVGDIVALKSAEDATASNQYRFTVSLTRANTNNTRVFGVLGNYTTGTNNTNITPYMALMIPKSQLTFICANSSMMNFEKDFFNTTTTMLSKKFKGNWKKLTIMGGLNFTAGSFGSSNFTNLSSVCGGFYSFNVTKRLSGSLLCLAVYSPFTQFYDGQWWESSILLVPFNAWDFGITKTFKLNISISGVYEANKSVINYQVLTGGKILF